MGVRLAKRCRFTGLTVLGASANGFVVKGVT